MNKRDIVRKILMNSGAEPEAEPAAFFMAGLPGSGKTEISKNLIKDSGVKLFRIDMDEIAEMFPGYAPEKADEFRKPATAILSECLKYALHHKISFLMDGAFGSSQAERNIERSLKHGFSVQLVYALQDPRIAWQFTVAREKVEHRAIKFDGFVETYYKIAGNLKQIGEVYGNEISIDIALKDKENKVGEWKRGVNPSDIDGLLRIEYNKDKLVKYILGAQNGAKSE